MVLFAGLVALAVVGWRGAFTSAQNPAAAPEPTAVVRLRVRPKVDGKEKGLPRKRFYLIPGSLADNQALVAQLTQQPIVSRECFYRGIKASDALIEWLDKNDCESVYCRSIEMESVSGPAAVPEFQYAFEHAPKEYLTPELKLSWLTTLLPEAIRDGFYRKKQDAIKELLRAAEAGGRGPVKSVMTDRLGTAYFTELKPGTYTLTNLLPTEFGKNSLLWTCELTVKPDDLSSEKAFQISTVKDKRSPCAALVTPLPACPANAARPGGAPK